MHVLQVAHGLVKVIVLRGLDLSIEVLLRCISGLSDIIVFDELRVLGLIHKIICSHCITLVLRKNR